MLVQHNWYHSLLKNIYAVVISIKEKSTSTPSNNYTSCLLRWNNFQAYRKLFSVVIFFLWLEKYIYHIISTSRKFYLCCEQHVHHFKLYSRLYSQLRNQTLLEETIYINFYIPSVLCISYSVYNEIVCKCMLENVRFFFYLRE